MILSMRKNRWIHSLAAVFLAVLLFCFFGGISHAATATTTATIDIKGGDLSVSAPNELTVPANKLDGYKQTAKINAGTLGLVDARGTGTGYRLDVSSPVLSGDEPYAAGQLAIAPVGQVAKADPTSGDTPTAATEGNEIIDNGSAATLLKADGGKGMGSYNANLQDLIVTIPANTYAGTYKTTLTYNLTTAAE